MNYTRLQPLRKFARKAGLTKLARFPRNFRRWWERLEYRRNRPDTAEVSVGRIEVRYLVQNADEWVRVHSCYEDAHVIKLIYQSVGERGVFWDVGASVGLYACIVGKAINRGGRVVCFEPEKRSLERLKENVTLNGLTNVEICKAALGKTKRTTTLAIARNPSAGTHRLGEGKSLNKEGVIHQEVVLRRGDEIIKDEDLPLPNVIKIDVEGFEESVLQGLKGILLNEQCKLVVCEIHFSILESKDDSAAPKRIVEYLEKCGFSNIEWLDSSHVAAHKPRSRAQAS